MAKSRLELRRQAEAAEAQEKEKAATTSETGVASRKKSATKRKATTRRVREKPPERKRAVWIIYSGSMKEEGRYPYDKKEEAEARLDALKQRGRKLYWLQLVKELIVDGQAEVQTIEAPLEDDLPPDEELELEGGDVELDEPLEIEAGEEEAEEEEEEAEEAPAGDDE
jgi:hypothetical protein